MPRVDLDSVADGLYSLPREEFTAARNAAAQQARKQGRRDLAEQIVGLRRPSTTAWLANTVAREQPDEIAALVKLGDGLREAQRRLRTFDDEQYIDDRPPLALGALQALPVPGRLELGSGHELELHRADGHTVDGAAYWMPWLGVLVCGDYLSPVEIPLLGAGGSIGAYRATLGRLRPYVERAAHVVPGHGEPQRADAALALLADDDAYLEALGADPARAEPPPGRRSARQREIHAENVAAVDGDS